MKTFVFRVLLIFTLLAISSQLPALSATVAPGTPAAPNACISGPITGNTTWLLINSPYVICAGGVTIVATATLTIQPGVTVQFDSAAGNRLNVNGALSAIGTPTQPITLTGVVTAPGSWGGISAINTTISPALVNLSYVTLDYGGVNTGSTGAQLYADQAVVTITHSLIRYGNSHGVYVTRLAQASIHDTAFISNTRNAIQLNQPTSDIVMSGLSASINGVNGIFIAGGTTMNGRRQWANTGIPYVIDANVNVPTGAGLSIGAGAELKFTANGWLDILGEFKAIGLPNAPITLTGQIKTPGAWPGMSVHGPGVDQAIAQLDYVTVEYGGRSGSTNGANIDVLSGGQLVARHSLIRYSSTDGVRNDGANASVSILNSQIFSNSLYGVHNLYPALPILATNIWWGDANGPKSDTTACSPGNGDKVTNGVLFRPVLTSTNLSAEFPLSDAPILTLTPRRWFAPSDATTKVYFDITLRDANGAPLPGRIVLLHSSLGTPTSGGITDINGKTLAYLVSPAAGDADVTATLDPATVCDGAMSPAAKVTFTTPVNITDLFPNAPASYFDGNISLTPMPVAVGIMETIRAKLTNPLTAPITVDVAFGFAQSSIGLTFGPISSIVGQVIPANSTVTVTASFMPLVAGHYCVQVSYNVTAIGPLHLLQPQAGGQAQKQQNFESLPGMLLDAATKGPLQQAEDGMAGVNWFLDQAADTDPFGIPFYLVQQQISWMMTQAAEISKNLVGDPPRQDFTSLSIPPRISLPPLSPPGGVSPARAGALENMRQAMADVVYIGLGATTSFDRYGGASAANDLSWSSQQANAMVYYDQQLGHALITATQAMAGFEAVLVAENAPDITITISDVIAYQARLNTQGFDAAELAGYQSIGLTTDQIAQLRQHYLEANPQLLAGSPRQKLIDLVDRFTVLSDHLLYPANFAPSFSISGHAGLRPAASGSGNTLAQINETPTTLQLGNPLTQAASIEVRVRRVDLPADWMVSVSPAQVVLAPGEQTTVTVRIIPGAPTPQGSTPRVAIEGYAGSLLLGGVVIDIVVPNYVPFAPYHLYMPVVRR